MKRMLGGAIEVRGDARKVIGKLDATAIGTEEPLVGADTFQSMPPSAENVPFTAAMDESGRLTAFDLTMPEVADGVVPAGTWKFTFSRYGVARVHKAPPAKDVRLADNLPEPA